jgi:ferredoxin-type protein NapH
VTSASPSSAAAAVASKGWWRAYRWLLVRRSVQLGLLLLFLAGPWLGWWIVKGTLASSRTLDVLPLTDPFVALQSLAARHRPGSAALVGAAIVLGFYAIVGGRAYCAWVCPVNLLTDAAHWLRCRLGLGSGSRLRRDTRYWLMGSTLVVAAVTGTIAWEFVNPVTVLHRGLLFGLGLGWLALAALFLFDVLVVARGWCGHLCPVGAFYGLLGRVSLVRVAAVRRERCNECMACIAICPEPQVIPGPLQARQGAGPAILAGACSNCGRCVDVCSREVFEFRTRFVRRSVKNVEAAT